MLSILNCDFELNLDEYYERAIRVCIISVLICPVCIIWYAARSELLCAVCLSSKCRLEIVPNFFRSTNDRQLQPLNRFVHMHILRQLYRCDHELGIDLHAWTKAGYSRVFHVAI
jgi:hypothetical protein